MFRILIQILRKELTELTCNFSLISGLLLVPIVLLLLIGNINVRESVVHVAILFDDKQSADGCDARDLPDKVKQLKKELEDLSNVTLTCWANEPESLLARAQCEHIDLIATLNGGWHFYTPQTNPYKLQYIFGVVQSVRSSLERKTAITELVTHLDSVSSQVTALSKNSSGAGGPAAQENSANNNDDKHKPVPEIDTAEQVSAILNELHEMTKKLKASAAVPTPLISAALSNGLTQYFPGVSRVDRSAIPRLIALVAIFVSFLLTSGALVREREAGMLDMLLVVSRGKPLALVVGKLILPIVVSLISLLLLLVVSRTSFGIGMKPGALQILSLQILAIVSAGLAGLAISTLVRTQQQAYLVSAAYLLGLVLVTGFFYPIEQAATPVQIIACAFPLTFSGPPFEAWMNQGASSATYGLEFVSLGCQCVAMGAICAAAWRRFARDY